MVAEDLFFNLIVYFLFHLNRSLSKKKDLFCRSKMSPNTQKCLFALCSTIFDSFVCSFFRQCFWHFSWIIYWTEGSLFICTPHIQSGPISNFTLSLFVFLLSCKISSQRESEREREKKDNVIQIVFHFFLSFLILCSCKEICILPTIPLFILTG